MACKYAATEDTTKGSSKVKLWVESVNRFSSQYNHTTWGAGMVVGQPKVYPKYGDIHGAWAPGDIDGNQFLELAFEEKLYIETINIYETYHAGGLSKIQAKQPDGNWSTIWQTPKLQNMSQSRIFSPKITKLTFPCDELKIFIDCTYCDTWVEIDAVQIVGTRYAAGAPPSSTKLANDLSQLVNSKKFSDVTFLVEGQLFYGHRAILMVRSEFFRAMFEHDEKNTLKEKPVEFNDVRKSSFEIMLHFMYTNNVPADLPGLLLVDVWRVADRFNIEGLQNLATHWITNGLNTENVVEIYLEAINHLPRIDDLNKVCLNYMSINMADIVRTKAFKDLPQDVMLDLIQIMTSQLKIK